MEKKEEEAGLQIFFHIFCLPGTIGLAFIIVQLIALYNNNSYDSLISLIYLGPIIFLTGICLTATIFLLLFELDLKKIGMKKTLKANEIPRKAFWVLCCLWFLSSIIALAYSSSITLEDYSIFKVYYFIIFSFAAGVSLSAAGNVKIINIISAREKSRARKERKTQD